MEIFSAGALSFYIEIRDKAPADFDLNVAIFMYFKKD